MNEANRERYGSFICASCGGDVRGFYVECSCCGLRYCAAHSLELGANCRACRGEYMTDTLLLRLLLACFGMSRETALKLARGHLLNGGGR